MNKLVLARDDKRSSREIIESVRYTNALTMLPGIFRDVYDVAAELGKRDHADIQHLLVSTTDGTIGIAYVSCKGYCLVSLDKISKQVYVTTSKSWRFLKWFSKRTLVAPKATLVDIHYQVKKLKFGCSEGNCRKVLLDYIEGVRLTDKTQSPNRLELVIKEGVRCVIEPNDIPGSPYVRVTECEGFKKNHKGLIGISDLLGLIELHNYYKKR